MGEREFVLFMALVAAMSALAVDILLPAFGQMRPAFGLDDDSTRLSLTVTLSSWGRASGTCSTARSPTRWGASQPWRGA